MNAKNNFVKKGFKPLSVKLLGHKDMIRGVDGLGDHVLSGSEDNTVKLWNIKTKKWITYTEHINWVTKVLLLDNFAVSGSADRAIYVRPIDEEQGQASFYRHDGWITGLTKLDDTRILSWSTDGKLKVYDCQNSENVHTCTAHESGIKWMCLNDDLICSYSPEDSKVVIRDTNTFEVIGEIDNTLGATTSNRSQYNMSKFSFSKDTEFNHYITLIYFS